MTKHARVIGWPIEHSKSPLIHTYWLEQHGIDGHYDKTAVAPEGLAKFVQDAWDCGMAGFNATIPHKEALMDLVEPDETAKAIGAINTVYRGPDGWIGTNTDGEGWLKSLNLKCRPSMALIIGAGGAARAVDYALSKIPVEIKLTNRTLAKAKAFGRMIEPWPGPQIDARGYDLIVNTSACGMNGENPLTLIHLDPGTVVSDLVYTPLRTHFLQSAEALDGIPVDGLGMLLHQAAGGFEKWFGVRPEVTEELREHVLNA